MKKNKKILTLLSTTAITGLMLIGLCTTASAKTTAIDINGTDGKVYEYDYASLKTSALACVLNGANDPGAKLYNDFMTRNKTIIAFYDDAKKSYIDANVVKQAAVNVAISGNASSFILDTFTSSTSTPTITLTPSKISTDSSGNVIVNGLSSTPAVDLSTLQLNTTAVPYTTAVTFKLNVSDPQDYTVTVKGITAAFDSSTDTFGAAINGTLSISNFSQSDFVITSKSAISTPTISTINNITVTVNQGNIYSLPSTVQATMSDGSTQNVSVTWNKQVDTSQVGTFTFNGTVNGYSGTVVLTLDVNASITVTSVSLNKTTDVLTIGGMDVLTATVSPSNATNQAVTWQSSNTNVAVVFNGLIIALRSGTATITVTTVDGNNTASCNISINSVANKS